MKRTKVIENKKQQTFFGESLLQPTISVGGHIHTGQLGEMHQDANGNQYANKT